MKLSGIFILLFFSLGFVSCVNNRRKNRKNVSLALLGFQIDNSVDLNKPMVNISPVLLLPRNIYLSKQNTNEREEIKFKVVPIQTFESKIMTGEDTYDIDATFRQALNRDNDIEKSKSNETFSETFTNSSNIEINEDVIVTTTPFVVATATEKGTPTTSPNVTNANKDVNNDTINPMSEIFELPLETSNWTNFSIVASSQNITITAPIIPDNGTKLPTSNETTTIKSPYTAALYNNAFIDQLSITTNSYINDELLLPPFRDDRWRTFSPSNGKLSSGFKPLAGLYYDGYLEKPLIKIPIFDPFKDYSQY